MNFKQIFLKSGRQASLLRIMLLLALVMVSHSAQAMRCGNDLVLKGDSQESVLERCGAPKFDTTIIVPCIGIENGCKVKRWAYDKGRRHYSMVYIREGRVIKVETEAK